MVIVNVDWGIPDEPNVTDRQKEYGHALADAGADVVLGHNTVVQKIEKHKGTNIFYSLGNVTLMISYQRTRKVLPCSNPGTARRVIS